jgi:dienelactone hydrolase
MLTASFEKGNLAVLVTVGGSKIEGFFLKPIPPTAPPAAYVKPEQFSAVEVTIGKAPFVLGGTLTLPKGSGLFPAVVLVHGSGPNDRDETLGANKPFKDLAEGLASAGVVVIRYEKRTLTYGAKYAGKEITFDEEIIDDARAAIDVLKTRPEVDTKKIYVVGHSLGALFAPAVAKKGKGVAGLALLAPSSRKPWDIIPQQMKYLGVAQAQLAEVEKSFAAVKSGTAKGSVLNAPVSYWKAWAAFDGPAVAKSLGIPVLVLHGSRDYQVIDVDFAGWKKGLTGAKSAELVELPGLNHLFIAGEGPPSPKEYEVPSHVAPEVIARLVSFCR